MKSISEQQDDICKRFDSEVITPIEFSKVGIALRTLNQLPLTAIRHQPTNGTCGWYIWGGEYSETDDFFQPMHVEHLCEHCPDLIPYLALQPGWGIVLAPDYEDVWFEAWRAECVNKS
jgi:hypothetical protein